jgi:DNA mismatch repair protein MSH2
LYDEVELYIKSGTDEWALCKKASPGNISDFDELLGIHASNFSSTQILAVKIVSKDIQKHCAVAVGCKARRAFEVYEFADNDAFTNLESVLVQHNASECLLFLHPKSTSAVDRNKLLELLQRCGVLVSEMRAAAFSMTNVEQDLRLLVGRSSTLL